MDLPKSDVKMSEWEHIGNVQHFLETQFQICEQAGVKYSASPAWERLIRFYEVVKGT